MSITVGYVQTSGNISIIICGHTHNFPAALDHYIPHLWMHTCHASLDSFKLILDNLNAAFNTCSAHRGVHSCAHKKNTDFTELNTKLDVDTLLDFTIHCRQNEI
jgi:hypothetical protein